MLEFYLVNLHSSKGSQKFVWFAWKMLGVAFAAHDLGDFEQAIEAFAEAGRLWDEDETVLAEGAKALASERRLHPEVELFLCAAIGQVYQTAGCDEAALAAALDGRQASRRLGSGHPDAALADSNIAAAYYNLGQPALAVRI
eukprot:SAG11_NODE_5193_length_1634_cov_1.435179_1_plen_142_part_00